ncbi:MAG: hypothetical protein ABIC40_05415 [bacterium]
MFNKTRIVIVAGILIGIFSTGFFGCGSNTALPDTNGGTRILAIDFKTKVPSLIAFSRLFETKNGPTKDIFVMFPDGSHEKRLTSETSDEDLPAFSPNGLAFAMVSNRGKLDWGNRDAWRLNNPHSINRLTNDGWEFNSVGIDWGPDFIIVARLNTLIGAPFDFIGLEEISIDGKFIKTIGTGFIASYDPCISPDGKTIAFCARPDCPSEFDPGCMGTLQLFVLTEGESAPRQLTNFEGTPQDPILIRNPGFDFGGTKIVFQTNYWSKDWDIGYTYFGGKNEGELVRVTDDPGDDVEPCFDPTGDEIAFASNRDGNFEIYNIRYNNLPEGSSPEDTVERLTNTPEDESNPDWSNNYL